MRSRRPGTSGDDPEARGLGTTERARRRAQEEEHYLPVIIKRTDETLRHPDDVLTSAIVTGLEQLNRRTLSLGLSSVTGGLILGFTAMAVAVVTTAYPDLAPARLRIAKALVYPLGFVVCMMGGAEIFTEHTATAVYPVLDRQARVRSLLRLWLVIAGGNLVGAAASALLLTWADGVIAAEAAYVTLGQKLVEHPNSVLLASCILAGWLMALGAWLVLATPPRVSQAVLIYIVTFLIGLGGLHHSIAGSVELFAAWLAGAAISLADGTRFLGIALLGNLIGGSVFVAILNYGHIRKSQAGATPSDFDASQREPAARPRLPR